MTKVVRFGVFEADCRTGELRKQGLKIRVQGRSFQLLQALLERPGELVTREELRQLLWAADVFVDFESGLNTAANRLRIALGDSADSPRYVETLARGGYRFIAPVEVIGNSVEAVENTETHEARAPVQPVARQPSRRWWWTAGAAALAVTAIASAFTSRRSVAVPFRFRQMTFRQGQVWGARFAPDGQSVLYTANWDNGRRELFLTNGYSPESRSLGIDDARLVSVSRSGELALMSFDGSMPITGGTLARVAMNGGSPMTIDRHIMSADWAPDGNRMAIVRAIDGNNVLEFPAGQVIHQTSGSISSVRISPSGDRIAFIEHPVRHDNRGTINVIASGRVQTLGEEWPNAGGLAWNPQTHEIWFTASRDGSPKSLWAASLSGIVRPIAQIAGTMTLRDVAPDGRALATRDTELLEMAALVGDNAEPRNLSWLDWSRVADVSADGQLILFDESGVAAGAQYQVYVRHLDTDRTTRLGQGRAMALSPDGRLALILGVEERARFRLVALDGGSAHELPATGLDYQWARFFPDGAHLLALASEPAKPLRLYVQELDGKPIPITPPMAVRNVAIAPDGKRVAVLTPKGKLMVYPTAPGGTTLEIRTSSSLAPLLWMDDDDLYAQQMGSFTQIPTVITRLRLSDGHVEPWREIKPADPLGVNAITKVMLSQDARTLIFNYRRVMSELFVMEPAR